MTDNSLPKPSRLPPALWIFLAAFALRLPALIHFAASPYFLPVDGDMKFYNDWALRILHGQWTDHQAFYGLPGYAFFLACIYFVAGFSPFLVGLLQTAAEAATSVLIFEIAKEAFRLPAGTEIENRGRRTRPQIVGALAALGWVFFQPAQAFSVVLMPTSWLVLAFWGCVWRVLKIRGPSVWRPWLWMGLVIGGVAMMVATIFFLIPLLVAAIFLKLDADKALGARLPKILAACAVLFAGVFAGVSPCWLHNGFIAGEPVLLSAHSGVNFYIGNNATANGYPKIPPGLRAGQEGMLKDSITMAEAAAGHKLRRAEVSRYWSEKAGSYIRGHFGDWLKLMAHKFRNFWNAFQYDDLGLVTLFAQDGILTPGLRFGFVAASAIPGMLVAAWKYRRSRWVIVAIFLHNAALMPVFVTERYRLAAVPGLLLMAGIGLWELGNFLAQKKWGPVFLYGAAAGAAVWFVAQPTRDEGLWSLDFYNTGIKAMEAGNLERAQKNLETAYAYVPDNSETAFALGNLWLQKKDRTRAKQFYKRAIELNGRHSGAWNNLGVLAMEEKRWKLAESFLARSVAIEPGEAKTWYLLAQAKAASKDFAGAREAMGTALGLEPQRPQFQQFYEELRGK